VEEPSIKHRIVVFIDMLGFSALVKGADDQEQRQFRDLTFSSLLELDKELGYLTTPLERRFAAFHGVIETHVRAMVRNDAPHSVSFSDSAFVAFYYPIYAYRFAVDVMRDLILRKTPARIGIAKGSFFGRRFSSDATEFVQRHSFQFYGKGVVGAHEAESCGVKGMRILLHPDIEPFDECFPLQDDDVVRNPDKLAVTHELSYAFRDYPGYMHVLDDVNEDTSFDADRLAVAIQLMAREAPDVEKVQIQYERTQHAVRRMRGLPHP
jgi:hypothetical protein